MGANSDDFSDIKLTDVPVPLPEPGFAVVAIKAAAVNPIDWMVMAGFLNDAWKVPLPFTMGYDFAGSVSAVHPDDSNAGFKVGDDVFAVNWGQHHHNTEGIAPGGSFAEYIKVPLTILSKKPDALSYEQAAAVALVGTTAYEATLEEGKVGNGQKVLIFGGAGAVGQIGIQLAKNAGAWVATTASKRTRAFVETLGPDLIVDYTEEDWTKIEALKGVDVVLDFVGEKDGFAKAKEAKVIKETGRFISIAAHDAGFDPTAHAPLSYAAFFCLANSPTVQDKLAAGLVDGSLKLPVESTFPFTDDGLQALLAAQKKGKAMGKLVFKF